MAGIEIRKSKLSEVFDLAPRLRLDDAKECEAMGVTSLEALKTSYRASYIRKSVYTKENILIGMFGATKKGMPKGYATIWFLGSNESENYPISFVREGKNLIKEVLKDYSILNYVYSENKSHIEYLKRIGLEVDEANPVTFEKGEFYPFYKIRKGE